MGLMRSAGHALHRLFAWHPALAGAYLRLWHEALIRIPDGRAAAHFRANLTTMRWPEGLRMNPIRLPYPGGMDVLLRPRPETLAFSRALLYPEFAHEPGVFRFLAPRMKRYDSVVEVGANIGVYTVFFSKQLAEVPGAAVMAYEPSPAAFADLQDHLVLNGCRNVAAHNCAVSPGPRRVAFYGNARDWTKGSLDRGTAQGFGNESGPSLVPNVTGDDILPLVAERRRLLLKIDVVGAEAIVLATLERLVREKRPDIVLGVWRANLASLNALAFLREGYRLARIDEDALVAREAFADDDYCNYFLEPSAPANAG